jgi:hypothetical protein
MTTGPGAQKETHVGRSARIRMTIAQPGDRKGPRPLAIRKGRRGGPGDRVDRSMTIQTEVRQTGRRKGGRARSEQIQTTTLQGVVNISALDLPRTVRMKNGRRKPPCIERSPSGPTRTTTSRTRSPVELRGRFHAPAVVTRAQRASDHRDSSTNPPTGHSLQNSVSALTSVPLSQSYKQNSRLPFFAIPSKKDGHTIFAGPHSILRHRTLCKQHLQLIQVNNIAQHNVVSTVQGA